MEKINIGQNIFVYPNPVTLLGTHVEHKTFSINVPRADMVETTDYCGLVSGKTTDKSNVFEIFYGELTTAPMIKECSLSFECNSYWTVGTYAEKAWNIGNTFKKGKH